MLTSCSGYRRYRRYRFRDQPHAGTRAYGRGNSPCAGRYQCAVRHRLHLPACCQLCQRSEEPVFIENGYRYFDQYTGRDRQHFCHNGPEQRCSGMASGPGLYREGIYHSEIDRWRDIYNGRYKRHAHLYRYPVFATASSCYMIGYTDACGNNSPASGTVCPVVLAASLQKDNTVNLTWSAFNGWKNGVQGYTLEKV